MYRQDREWFRPGHRQYSNGESGSGRLGASSRLSSTGRLRPVPAGTRQMGRRVCMARRKVPPASGGMRASRNGAPRCGWALSSEGSTPRTASARGSSVHRRRGDGNFGWTHATVHKCVDTVAESRLKIFPGTIVVDLHIFLRRLQVGCKCRQIGIGALAVHIRLAGHEGDFDRN